jgi:hypothetical protein
MDAHLNSVRKWAVMSEIMGTAFLVEKTWYLRYLHGGGIMVPIEGSAEILGALEDGRMVRLTGQISTDGRRCLRAARRTQIDLLGG